MDHSGREKGVCVRGGRRGRGGGQTARVHVIDADPDSPEFNRVIETIALEGDFPAQMAIHPDGSGAYLADGDRLMLIDASSGKVSETLPLAGPAYGTAVSPDGSEVYVATREGVCVIDTAAGRVAETIRNGPSVSLVITPDGARAYVSHANGSVTAIDVRTRCPMAVAFEDRPGLPDERPPGSAIRPESSGVRFAAFEVRKVRLKVSEKTYRDRFRLKGSFSLGEGSDGIDPLHEDVTVTFGGFSETIPAGSFVRFREVVSGEDGAAKGFRYKGRIGGVTWMKIHRDGKFRIRAMGLQLSGLDRHAPIPFILRIGDDLGETEVRFERKSRFLKRGRGNGEKSDAR